MVSPDLPASAPPGDISLVPDTPSSTAGGVAIGFPRRQVNSVLALFDTS
jgi:hypothetical protein